jgi:hypothetical protein
MGILVLTVAVIAVSMLAMAIGVVLKRPCLRGSCGGPEVLDPEGDSLSCEACPRRRENARKQSPGG